MDSGITRRSRFLGYLAGTCLLLAATLGQAGGTIAAHARTTEPPLDLAAMTLRPPDLEAEGLADYGMSWSLMGARAAAIEQFVDSWGWDEKIEDGKALREADADRTYLLHIAQERESDGWVTSDSLVATFVMEFADADAAEAGFANAAAVWGDDLDVSTPDIESGDEQLLFSGTGIDTLGSDPYERALLLFRSDNLVAGVSIHFFTSDETPDQALVEALAERQADRIDAVRDDGGPGLSGQLVRLRLDGRMTNWDYYVAENGEANRLAATSQSPDQFAEYQDELVRTGVVERYHLEQIVSDDGPTGDIHSWFNATLNQYEDEDAARAFMVETAERMGENDESTTPVDAPALGDEALAYLSVTSNGDDRYRIFVRAGSTIFWLTHVINAAATANPVTEPQAAAINELAEVQLACIEGARSCERGVRVPEEMRDGGSTPGSTVLTGFLPIIARRETMAA